MSDFNIELMTELTDKISQRRRLTREIDELCKQAVARCHPLRIGAVVYANGPNSQGPGGKQKKIQITELGIHSTTGKFYAVGRVLKANGDPGAFCATWDQGYGGPVYAGP